MARTSNSHAYSQVAGLIFRYVQLLKVLFVTETSSLNVFHVTPDGTRLLMSTDTADLPAPAFAFPCSYPTRRTSRRMAANAANGTDNGGSVEEVEAVCRQHTFEFVEFRQIRRGDESESAIYRCSVCSRIRIG